MSNGKTILVIDDDTNLRLTLTMVLQKNGYTVTAAGNASQALQCLEAGPFDLAFLDLKMPEVDGLALLRQIRQRYADMPIIILTAHATLHSSIEAVRHGARDYLLKPVDPPLILQTVREVLGANRVAERREKILAQIQTLFQELQQLEAAPPHVELNAPPLAASARFLQRGVLTIDLHARRVIFQDKILTLTQTDFDYLVVLARHAPNAVSYQDLALEAQAYQLHRREAQDLVRWRIHNIRRALEPNPREPRYLLNVRGVGYCLAL
jgi:DNA-binding response OmpR family regulator